MASPKTLVSSLLVTLMLCFSPIHSSNSIGKGYRLISVQESPDGGFIGYLQVKQKTNIYGSDITTLRLFVKHETDNRLRVHITDAEKQRWEVPYNLLPREQPPPSGKVIGKSPTTVHEISGPELIFSFTKDPFSFAVKRRSNGQTLFNTSSDSNSNSPFGQMVFKDQYLEISTSLPKDASLYGLGENSQAKGIKLVPNEPYTLYTEDVSAINLNTDLYGSHPVYMDLRNVGGKAYAHAVLLLNSNGMDVFYRGTSLTYKVIGGVFDFYFVAGPSPLDVVDQYTSLIGRPAPMPYWSLEMQMARIEHLQFPALKITGENYVGWVTNVKPYLIMKKLTETIVIGNKSPPEHKAEAIIFLKKHLDENVTHDYASIEDPAELWQALKERFDNQKEVNLPHALEEWKNLRFQDFQKVEEYNSAVLRIVSLLKYCGNPVSEAEMMNKTYNTFHKQLHFLPEIYRKCGYTRFSELMVALMLAEKNNELLIRNHNSRPTGAKAFPEVNATSIENSERRTQTSRGRGRGRHFNSKRGKTYNPKWKGSNKWVRSEQGPKGKETQEDTTQKRESVCYRCGCKGHWSRTCRTPPHLCKLYQESTKGKAKEVNLTENFEGTSYLDASDFANELD